MALDLPAIIAAIRPAAREAIDGLLDALGKDCRLVFPGRPEYCANCLLDPVGNKSSNRFRAGGPMPFANGSLCPQCGGKGLRTGEVFQDVKLLCSWEPSTWWLRPPRGVEVPDGSLQTKGYLRDLPRVLQSRLLVVEVALQPVREYRFQMDGEPVDPGNIVQARYFVCTWRRAGK